MRISSTLIIVVCNNPLIYKVMEEILLQAYTTSDNHDFFPSLDFDSFTEFCDKNVGGPGMYASLYR